MTSELKRLELGKKTEAMNHWSNGGDLYYWDGLNLKQWTTEQLKIWDCSWYDYIIFDEKFGTRALNSWMKYNNGRDIPYKSYIQILDLTREDHDTSGS